PLHLKQFHAHGAHLREKSAQEANDLAVEPIQNIIEDSCGHKIPEYIHIAIHLLPGENKGAGTSLTTMCLLLKKNIVYFNRGLAPLALGCHTVRCTERYLA